MLAWLSVKSKKECLLVKNISHVSVMFFPNPLFDYKSIRSFEVTEVAVHILFTNRYCHILLANCFKQFDKSLDVWMWCFSCTIMKVKLLPHFCVHCTR